MNPNPSVSDSRGFTGNLSLELLAQRERLKPLLLEKYDHVSDADIDAALLDYARETKGAEVDEELLANLEKRLGLSE